MHYEYDKYSYLDSPLHRWDPRYKIIGLLILTFCISFTRTEIGVLSGFVVSFFLLFISKIPFRFVLKKLALLSPFFLMMLLIMPLTYGSNPLFEVWRFKVYDEGLRRFSIICIRIVSIVTLLVSFLASEKFNITLKSLMKLKVSEKIVNILLISHNYIYYYREKLRRLTISARLRGGMAGSIRIRYRTFAGIILNLLVTSFEQSERLASAMALRGFDSLSMKKHKFYSRPLDTFKLIITVLLSLAVLAMEFLI